MMGIYQIKNVNDGKVYIGQAINAHRRHIGHFSRLRLGKHYNSHLQYAFNKNGGESFEFTILEEISKAELLTPREQYWLDIKQSYNRQYGYNIASCAESSSMGVKRSEEFKRNLSEIHKGKHLSKETITRLSISRKGILPWSAGKPLPAEVCRKISETKKRLAKPPWNKGKTGVYSQETLAKMSHIPWNKGKDGVYTQETRLKMRDSHLGRKYINHTKGK